MVFCSQRVQSDTLTPEAEMGRFIDDLLPLIHIIADRNIANDSLHLNQLKTTE